jgi:hypothetical protein
MDGQRRLGLDRREGLLRCLLSRGRDADARTQDVRIEGGHEYSQPFWFTMGPNESNTVRKCDIYVYRWDQPSRFVEYPGSSRAHPRDPSGFMFITGTNKRYPGFEILCSVEADLRAPYVAAPLQIGQRDKRFKTVKVRLPDPGRGTCCSWSPVRLVPDLRGDRADSTFALEGKGMRRRVRYHSARHSSRGKDIFQYGRATIAHRPLTGDAS